MKNIDGAFTRGLADVLLLSPVSYHWNAASGLDTSTQYSGFSAQNVQQAIPEAVGSSTNGYLTLQDRPLIAAIVNAMKEIASISGAFRYALVAWLGDTGNGIEKLFAHEIHGDILCAGATCVNEEQLAALLAGAASAASGPSSASPSGDVASSTAPVVELYGNATSTVPLGTIYLDLGAHIISPASDTNLGIAIVLDGATTTAVAIDTSAPGQHTILYTVTSPTTGLTGSAMRTVIVASPGGSDESDNPFHLPANDNPQPQDDAAGF